MIKIIKFFILELLIVFTLIIIIPSFLIKEKFIVNDESISVLESFTAKNSYTQTIANSKNLNSISVLIKNPSIQNNSNIFIDIENEKQNKLKEFVISGSNVGDPSWVKLKFDPILENNVILKISTENTQPDSLKIFYKNNKFNLKATIKNNSFISRLKDNFRYQYNQFISRSLFCTISYLTLILLLNYFYEKNTD